MSTSNQGPQRPDLQGHLSFSCPLIFPSEALFPSHWEGGTKPRITALPTGCQDHTLILRDPLGVQCAVCSASLMQTCKDGFIKVRGGTLASCSFPVSLQSSAVLCFLEFLWTSEALPKGPR